jgi:hypothetical protein
VTESAERKLLCPNGVELPVAVSAMTKSLRRSREVEAFYWAQQIQVRYPKYLWRRLGIFAAEDVGIADPQAVSVVASLSMTYRAILDESRAFRPDGVIVAMACMYLARAPKSREADDLKNAVAHLIEDDGWSAPIPPEAYDMHTAEGRDRHTADEQLTQWLTEGRRIVNDAGPLDWRLWIDRRMARHGVLDRDEVEAHAVEWDEQGRLVFGLDGYKPRPD